MTTEAAPLLRAEAARYLLNRRIPNLIPDSRIEDFATPEIYRALQALADGRTACVRVLTEDEQRTAFYEFIDDWMRVNKSYPSGIDCWLACARAMGAISGVQV